MKGKIESIGPVENVASGTRNNKAWILWSTKLTVDGNDYGYSDFEKKDLEAKLAKLKIGSTVEFETEEKDGYTNVKRKTEVKVLEEGNGAAGPAAAPAKPTDHDIEQIWKKSKDFVLKELEGVATNSFADAGPSVNTIVQAKLRLRGLR